MKYLHKNYMGNETHYKCTNYYVRRNGASQPIQPNQRFRRNDLRHEEEQMEMSSRLRTSHSVPVMNETVVV